MSIGHHTTWIIVDLHSARAVSPEGDRRQTLRFLTRPAAVAAHLCLTQRERDKANANSGAYDTGRYLVVEVPA